MFHIAPSGGSFTVRFIVVPLIVAVAVAVIARRRRRLAWSAGAIAVGLAGAWVGLYAWRPRWLAVALADPGAPARMATPVWTARADGLETADADVELAGERVDAIALVRLDPTRYALSVHHGEPRTAETWRRDLDAAVVINGSYVEANGTPSTPVALDHRWLGPSDYVSDHGALAIGRTVDIVDLRGRDPVEALAGARDAMVSYPLMSRAGGHDDWLASRVFVGIDRSGRIVIGTTRGGFFSLRRLGALLADSPLDLRIALNLDGGPLASQVVSAPHYFRAVHGSAEITGGGDLLRLAYQAATQGPVDLPLVLAATRR